MVCLYAVLLEQGTPLKNKPIDVDARKPQHGLIGTIHSSACQSASHIPFTTRPIIRPTGLFTATRVDNRVVSLTALTNACSVHPASLRFLGLSESCDHQ